MNRRTNPRTSFIVAVAPRFMPHDGSAMVNESVAFHQFWFTNADEKIQWTRDNCDDANIREYETDTGMITRVVRISFDSDESLTMFLLRWK